LKIWLIPGAKVTVLRGNFSGATVIAVKDFRLLIGLGMAQKITVG
jgi:Fe2+ transport system protein FeoA